MTVSRSDDMRAIVARLDEAGLARKMATHVAAEFGHAKSQGEVDQHKLAKKFKDEYNRYLGQTGKESNETNLLQFLVAQIGFTAANARELLKQSGIQDPISKTESIVLEMNGTQLNTLFTNAAKFAFAHNLVGKDGAHRSRYGYDDYGSRSRRRGQRGVLGDLEDFLTGATGDKDNDEKKDGEGDMSNASKLDKNKMLSIINKLGMDDSDISDLNFMVNKDKYENIANGKDPSALRQLAIVGYAYLKANGK